MKISPIVGVPGYVRSGSVEVWRLSDHAECKSSALFAIDATVTLYGHPTTTDFPAEIRPRALEHHL